MTFHNGRNGAFLEGWRPCTNQSNPRCKSVAKQRSSAFQLDGKTEGLAPRIMKAYEVGSGETIIIVNAYGINPVTIDAALEAKKIGAKSIGLTSTGFALNVPKGGSMRHSSGKNLHEVVDVFIDCQLPLGDAVIDVPGCSQRIGPTSTILNSYCLNLLVAVTVQKLVERGIEPPVWMSANLPEGDANNKKWHAKYNQRVRHLR